MTKTEALEVAAAAHANLLSRLDGIDVRELDGSWTQDECAAKRELAHVQYMHSIDSITALVNA